jgi:hypothetical protein
MTQEISNNIIKNVLREYSSPYVICAFLRNNLKNNEILYTNLRVAACEGLSS